MESLLSAIPGLEQPVHVVSGNFSHVYRAWDAGLARWVAVKVPRHVPAGGWGPLGPEEWRRRFVAEARILAAMDCPHLIRIDRMDRLADGRPCVAMPWHVANLRLEIGRDAKGPENMARRPADQCPRRMAAGRACEVLRQVCLGLAALHAKGYVHRDVKPTNLLLTDRVDGTVRLCDLGFAKIPGQEPEGWAGRWIGTPNYAAPEQMREALSATDRSDVYSVGVLAYRLLTGLLPVGAFRPASQVAEGVPVPFDGVIAAAMARRPGDRPRAVELVAALTALRDVIDRGWKRSGTTPPV
ncbi:serine/threonine-protein kinase [Magnetospirillum sp. UT-4]|uniref:serine/threonine-protein kinase n=1 Tax=Magnetospirillum sp. UT-4 TaxID=2681467 RepID=UPI00137C9CC3|nr:serine/threonine-protein kinase [Magnetospirillum sp. UT-4]CAA7623224.1 putative serine/threonine-protein kinase pknL [Magnetospirillum sp. UT-4]